ncbi:MAG: hypothetical protein R3F35_20530 [Myxococcota bacterium]
MRRIVVVGGASPLGRRVVERMRSLAWVESVRGVETRLPGSPRANASSPRARRGRTERKAEESVAIEIDVVPFVPDPRPLGEYLAKERIDTVVQCALVPDRSGLGAHAHEADVIATMCLGAAIGQTGSLVRSWVLASSSAVYPLGSHAALIHDEFQAIARDEGTVAASIAEAEDYARESAHRLPHVDVAILRLQQLAGRAVRGPLAALLARDPVPSPLGFDPAIQLLHLEDAADALIHAAHQELAGIYNVASAGIVHWSEALRAMERRALPLLPLGIGPFEPLLARLGLPVLPAELVDLLRFGHAIDTRKLERAGWRPRYDQRSCLEALDAPGSGSPGT